MLLKGCQLSTQFKIRSYGLERSQCGTEYKNQVKWSLNEVNWVNWVHNVKIRLYGLERSQLGT